MGLKNIINEDGIINREALDDFNKRLQKGEAITYKNKAFSSTSLDSENTEFNHRDVIIRTLVPKGTSAIYAEPFSVYGSLKNGTRNLEANAMLGITARSENELLLNAGLRHRILSVKVVDNRLEIYTIVEQS